MKGFIFREKIQKFAKKVFFLLPQPTLFDFL